MMLSVVMILSFGGKAKLNLIVGGWRKRKGEERIDAGKRRVEVKMEGSETTARRPVTNAKLVYRNTPFLFEERHLAYSCIYVRYLTGRREQKMTKI
mmetsp:Transcript_20075/g.20427  ORF Transcript_20075/g.20427 Transcript_20075/m.20427 type:complete len:96 (-) Transcript_20075:213-500(-)